MSRSLRKLGAIDTKHLSRHTPALPSPPMTERWKPSVTVAAIIEQVMAGESRFLLVEETTPEGLKLNNPAGHLELGESPQQAVVREALEETARVFTPDCLVGVYLSRFQRPAVIGPSGCATNPAGAAAPDAAQWSAGEDVTYLRLAFAGTVSEPDPARALDDGIVRTLWMTLAELRASRERHRSALVLKCIEDFVAGKRLPLDAITADSTLYAPEIKSGR